MTTKTESPSTLQEAILHFSDPLRCLNYLIAKRWPQGVLCPICGRKDVSFLAAQRKWQCKGMHEKRQFSVKVGTVMEDSAIGLEKWLCAFWMFANCKTKVSSYELQRAIGVTQKTAWFMLYRIRLARLSGPLLKMEESGGTI